MSNRFGTEDLLNCYRRGVFPMADSRDDPRLFIMDPDRRGILPLNNFHVPKRLRKTIRKDPFRVTADTAFNRVIEACGEAHASRPSTWINDTILNLYSGLHRKGHAHSIECWDSNLDLVGGLYGVSIGGAFFGESMFSRATDASKIALIHLVARLIAGGYILLDAQFHNPHLDQFGLIEIPRTDFHAQLVSALQAEADFYSLGSKGEGSVSGDTALHWITQIS
ncbi:MAG: leucyl/phenylalanyl-tRNA--protein transferase [Pseudomonadota bacterium]